MANQPMPPCKIDGVECINRHNEPAEIPGSNSLTRVRIKDLEVAANEA